METTTHKPEPGEPGWCSCGGQEVYFEGPPGPSGYGCEVDGEPWRETLLRLGFHIHPRAVVDVLARNDELCDSLTDAEYERLERFNRQPRPGGRRGR